MTTVYVSIGNSDDKLTQREWSLYREVIDNAIRSRAETVYGAWVSPSADPYQNACWAFSVGDERATSLIRQSLARHAKKFKQDSITWAETEVEFIHG